MNESPIIELLRRLRQLEDRVERVWVLDQATGGGGSGTVTSVGLSMPAEFSVANSPVTAAGTLAVTKASQSANTVYAAPNGSAGAPGFRLLVAADIPILVSGYTVQTIFTVDGALNSVGLCPSRIYNEYGATRTVTKVFICVGVAPTGSSVIVDVLKNGTTIFSNPAHRPQIASGANTGYSTSIDVASWAADDYLQVQVAQYGSTSPGSYLTVHIVHQ